MSCDPKEFYGNEGVVGLLSWIEGMESKLHINKCSDNNKVEYVACLLQGRALTWWNTQVQTRGREAALRLTWEEFKNLLLKEYCPKSEVQKLELEFWNHTMVGGWLLQQTQVPYKVAVVLANHLTNDAIRSRVWKKDNVGNKRREENQSRNQGGDHLRNTCPKLNKALGQGRNRLNPALAIEGNIDRRNNDNQTHGRAFIIGANEACQNL
ncbi:reverse transcriptase domain-containing protein [Tanacetum coccineum]